MPQRDKNTPREFFLAIPGAGKVSALLLRPAHAHVLLVLAHGAGAGMRHPFLESFSRELAASQERLEGVRGVVFAGFPLHPPNKPGTERAEHLAKVNLPMLFLQGTRDTLAALELLRPICKRLGPSATLHVVDTADHSFHVLKRSGKTDEGVVQELAQTVASWAKSL